MEMLYGTCGSETGVTTAPRSRSIPIARFDRRAHIILQPFAKGLFRQADPQPADRTGQGCSVVRHRDTSADVESRSS